jgi:hypothetical protein
MMTVGSDEFGRFTIVEGECGKCGHKSPINVKYRPRSFWLESDIKLESTILKSLDHRLGVTCGCYGKFHRQVTHIRTKRRKDAEG